MTKSYKKSIKTKVLIFQTLYCFYFDQKKNNTFILEKINLNKIYFKYLNHFVFNVIKKEIILNILISNYTKNLVQLGIVEMLIIKIALFEFYFLKKQNLNIIIAHTLFLANRFSSKNNYILIRKVLSIIITSYKIYKLIV